MRLVSAAAQAASSGEGALCRPSDLLPATPHARGREGFMAALLSLLAANRLMNANTYMRLEQASAVGECGEHSCT